MSICVLSGRYPETEFKSNINHKMYADAFGYSYIHCNWPTKTNNSYLNKIVYILTYIDLFDYIIWIDDDAFFFDFEKDIMDFAPSGDRFISLCKSPSYKELKTFFSSGQFILKSNKLSKKFLQSILRTNFEIVQKWWTNEMGYYTKGDQDIMVYLLLNKNEFKNKMDLFDYKCFNSRFENVFNIDVHKPLILHFTGSGKTKHENMLKIQEKLNLHPSLVSNTILKTYNIKTLEQYSVHINKLKNKPLFFKFLSKLKQWLKG